MANRYVNNILWRGDQVYDKTLNNVGRALTEFGLRVEADAKAQLWKGHGVLTGTLRRSIHCATPGFNWLGEGRQMAMFRDTSLRMKRVKKAMRGTSLGRQISAVAIPSARIGNQKPALVNGRLTLQVGSGLNYAIWVEIGHGRFKGYQYMQRGLNANIPKLPGILQKYQVKP